MKKNPIKIYPIIFSLLAVLSMNVLPIFTGGIIFGTNDDRYISEIFSGSLGNSAEIHAVYVNVIFGILFKFLFSLTTNISWYGLFLVLIQSVSFYLIGYCFVELKEDYLHFFVSFILWGLVLIVHFRFFACIQYTSIAAIASFSGYFLLLSSIENQDKIGDLLNNRKRLIVFFLLQFISFCLRDKSMLMIQVIGIMSLAISLFVKDGFKRMCKTIFIIGSIVLAEIAVCYLINRVAYSSDEWTRYNEYNEVRTDLFDYYGIPKYDDISQIADRYNVSKEEYIAFTEYNYFLYNIPLEMLVEVRDYAEEFPNNPEWLYDFKGRLELDHTYSIFCYSCILLALTICILILLKDWNHLIILVGLSLATCIPILYLLLINRYPYRVLAPLMSCVLFYCAFALSKNDLYKKWFISLLFGGIVIFCDLEVLKDHYYFIYYLVKESNYYDSDLHEILSYCEKNNDKMYLIHHKLDAVVRGNPFEVEHLNCTNSVVTGGWCSNSPFFNDKILKMFIDKERLYFITSIDEGAKSNNMIALFNKEATIGVEEFDSFISNNGNMIYIYCVEGLENIIIDR